MSADSFKQSVWLQIYSLHIDHMSPSAAIAATDQVYDALMAKAK